ncbi:MAG: DedA family protein [Patescibacteria group bacterium]|nr:DedA family protein [Patescibacteria group bacterium]MDE1988494.1 DedA family protein [Patescibacteria group bacterium]MDE2218137.1 DedA family protein [Patescibacteria group bacterium]
MSLISFIISYGYIAVFFGGIFEGEAVLILGGLAAYGGFLKLPLVLFFALIGAMVSDWSWFFAGRHKGKKLIEKWPKLKNLMLKPQKHIDKRAAFLSFALRFMYGFRTIVPLSLGMSTIKTPVFLFFNSLGLMCWVLSVGIAGYFFGDIMEIFLGRLKRYEFKIIIFTFIGAMAIYVIYSLIKYLLKKTF